MSGMVHRGEIRWTLEPAPAIEPLGLTPIELVRESVSDARVYRGIALEALGQLHAAQREIVGLRRQIAAQRDELRRYLRSQLERAA